VDIKTPGSGAGESFFQSNFENLSGRDEVKFVVTSKNDFDWAVALTKKRGLDKLHTLLFSPAWGLVTPKELARWLIDSDIEGRLSLQIHKFIWGSDATGV